MVLFILQCGDGMRKTLTFVSEYVKKETLLKKIDHSQHRGTKNRAARINNYSEPQNTKTQPIPGVGSILGNK